MLLNSSLRNLSLRIITKNIQERKEGSSDDKDDRIFEAKEDKASLHTQFCDRQKTITIVMDFLLLFHRSQNNRE